jgi:ElaB/YqjD/DUF883 family membrane-anchored ribosome-binding protein
MDSSDATAQNLSSQVPAPDAAESPMSQESLAQRFRDRFDSLIPEIQRRWPEVASHDLEATRGSLDETVRVIAEQTGRATSVVRPQLEEMLHLVGERGRNLADSLEPLERQLEQLLDELNQTLRPRIERPVRERPLLALAVAVGVGMLLGSLLAGGRRSA